MRVEELRSRLEAEGVHVIVGHHLNRDAEVGYRDTGDQFEDSITERHALDNGRDHVIVRQSGWVWVLGSGGRIIAGHSASKADTARIGRTLATLRSILGLVQPDTIGPDDDPVFVVADAEEVHDDHGEVAD